MAKQTINIGTAANDRTGDALRTAFTKVNANFTELYNGASIGATGPQGAAGATGPGLTDNGSLTLTNTGVLSGDYAGAAYTFVHNNHGSEVDTLSANAAITRGTQKGLYNPVTDASYDDSTSRNGSEGITGNIEWNGDGWNDLSNVTTRTYDSWLNTVNSPPGSVGHEYVIHNTDDDTYYTLKFTAWQSSAQGGGFSYTRRLINTVQPVLFTHSNNGDEVDYIDTDVAITRASQLAPYNPLVEEGWDSNVSPANTLWNGEGWDDLSNVTDRLYTTFYAVVGANRGVGLDIMNKELVMKDTVNNNYYKIKFVQFTGNNNGGGFQYTRELIDVTNPNVGIKFADGTVQRTAAAGIPQNRVKENYINYYLKKEDANKHLYIDQSTTLYVPDHDGDGGYPFPIGTTVTLVTKDNQLYIYRDNQALIYGAGFNQYAGWYLPPRSTATLLKVEENVWMLSGFGIQVD